MVLEIPVTGLLIAKTDSRDYSIQFHPVNTAAFFANFLLSIDTSDKQYRPIQRSESFYI
jgi:hypothetical protein